MNADQQQSMEAYLAALRRQLRDLMDDDVREIVEEIHGHILDRTSGDASPEKLAATLGAFGSPQQLALRYHTDELVQRARLTRSPALLFRTLLRWAALSAGGMAVFMLSGVGYCIGGMIFVMGLLKLFFPRQAGLNITRDTNSWGAGFGAGSGPHTGHDPVGLWLIPICLVLGSGILFLTFRLGLWSLRWFARPRRAITLIAVDE